ncbi:BRO-N domain-containing protein [Pseudovibrio ascidiaceicola]|uniref:BRO-N domain-containing protein n=1 Tax=Pseudovibrio ascidiaceicola TaxID=285279 RepID=UPI003D35C3AD
MSSSFEAQSSPHIRSLKFKLEKTSMNAIVKPQTMTPELSTFNFGELRVRVVMKNGEPWFVARDVCQTVGLGHVTQAIKHLDDFEIFRCNRITLGQLGAGCLCL